LRRGDGKLSLRYLFKQVYEAHQIKSNGNTFSHYIEELLREVSNDADRLTLEHPCTLYAAFARDLHLDEFTLREKEWVQAI
jgi:hypothetical protein